MCIGTDSEVRQDGIEFATVIVFLREKKGGFMYIRNQHSNKPMSLKERMITEVSMSVSYTHLDVYKRQDTSRKDYLCYYILRAFYLSHAKGQKKKPSQTKRLLKRIYLE